MMDEKLAADEARRVSQHEAVKSAVNAATRVKRVVADGRDALAQRRNAA